MKLRFEIEEKLLEGAMRIAPILGIEEGEGITLSAVESDKNGVVLKDGKAVIYYTRPSVFFRELCVLAENAHKGDFEIFEDTHFETLAVMIDASRCAVPTLESLYKMLDRLALMGYSMAMLYTEDTVKLEGRPFFGYMRGGYTADDLRALDDYANGYGIEVIPCIECYGHMEKYLTWGEAGNIKDTEKVLLAREDKTFEFLEQLIATTSGCFRSKRIHIGMDEAWGMGRGKFMDRHGYVEPFEIFSEFMERLIGITNKYGLKPMMWSDMYFRNGSSTHQYYDENIEIPERVASRIPREVQLVFWHYGEKHQCDNYMIKKHNELGRDVLFAGGLWSWIGHFPEHNYALETTRFSLEACRNGGVREVIATVWLNDNAECDIFANLYGLSFFAELCFDRNADGEKLARRFEAATGGDAEGFYTMSLYHNRFDEGGEYPNYNDRFFGKPIFWQDILEGLFDSRLFEKPMSGHYAACAVKMRDFKGGEWDNLYRFAELVFDYMAVKSLVAETLVPAYRNCERDKLAEIADVLLPIVKEKVVKVHEAHKALWFEHNRVLGWSCLDIRYAGVAARCDTAIMLLNRYLDGKDELIEELEEPRLKRGLSGFIRYGAVAAPYDKF